MTNWPDYYILVNRQPFAVDLMTWAHWFGSTDRTIAFEKLGKVSVSTVFLGLDHNFGRGDPLLFETMIFGGALDQEMWRYATWNEAMRGHEGAVAMAKKAAAQIRALMPKES